MDEYEDIGAESVTDNVTAEYLRDYLAKARKGVGSRGGKVLGYTKSGLAVYQSKPARHSSYINFGKKDHGEAGEMHHKLAQKHWDSARSGKGNPEASKKAAMFHEKRGRQHATRS